MATTPVAYTPNTGSPSTLPSLTSNKDYKMEFLKLLLTQMKYQDPTSTIDSTQMLAQQAQFASLEQMQNLNTNLVSLLAMQNVGQATNLLGKFVTGTDINGTTVINGQVTGVAFKDGQNVMNVTLQGGGNTTMYLPDIASVGI